LKSALEKTMTPGTSNDGKEEFFTYPFSNPKSPKKLLMAALFVLANFVIPILPGFILSGYNLEIQRKFVLHGVLELPEWTNLGKYFKDGAKAFAISCLYSLPILFFFLIGFSIIILPLVILDLGTLGQGEISPEFVIITGIISLAGLLFLGLVMLLSIVSGFVIPAAITHFAVKGKFSAAFNISEWWVVFRKNFSDYLIAYIIMIVIGILSSLLVQILSFTIVLCMLIPVLYCAIMVYTMLISAGLLAKAYRGGLEKTGEG
jgi:hypothetical protein